MSGSGSSASSSDSEEDLCEYEKQRLEKIRENQEVLKSLGFKVKNPIPPKKPKKRRKKKKSSSKRTAGKTGSSTTNAGHLCANGQSTSASGSTKEEVPSEAVSSDEEWKPEKENTTTRRRKPRGASAAKSKSKPPPAPKSLKQPLTELTACAIPLPDCFNSDLSDGQEFFGFPPQVMDQDIPSSVKFEYQLDSRFEAMFGASDHEPVDFQGFSKEELLATTQPVQAIDTQPQEREEVKVKESTEAATSRYPKRERAKKDYKEDELSDEDEYLFCEDCAELYHGDCPVHGPLLSLDPNSGLDVDSTQYTSVPVPGELTVKTSSLPDAGLGVFAKGYIPKGVRVGPYEGKKVLAKDMDSVADTSYIWEIRRYGQKAYYMDGRDPSESNWLRFINCARNEDEQNMVAFQYCGQIYYRTFKHVYPGSEMLVWYGEEYAKELGISVIPGMEPSYTCKGCCSSFVEHRSFQIHLKHSVKCYKANPQNFKCGKCLQMFNELHQLQYHIRHHEQMRGINTSTDNINELKSLPQLKEKPRNIKLNVKRQKKTIHNVNSKKDYRCEYCLKTFISNSQLKIHVRIHTDERPFHCTYCEKSFNQNSNLQKHERTHTGEKPYRCEVCDQAFSVKCNLQKHERTHTGDKPYRCQVCDQAFGRKGSLQQHERTHTGDKPYRCEVCDQAFGRKGSLQKHERTHTGDKPYVCKHCGIAYRHSNSLKSHIQKTHTSIKL